MKWLRSVYIKFSILVIMSVQNESIKSEFIPIKPNRLKTNKKCERIKIPMCKDIHYNMTVMPNMFNHENQDEAGFEAHQFYPLVQIKCSDDLLFFLCSIYTPICLHAYEKPLPPCRSVCERVKTGCDPLLRKYTFKWPEKMDCALFPDYNNPDKTLCMDKHFEVSSPVTSPADETLIHQDIPKRHHKLNVQLRLSKELSLQLSKQFNDQVSCSCRCRQPLVEIFDSSKSHFNKVNILGIPNCALGCKLAFFDSESDKKFITFWLFLWTIICLFSTFSVVSTFAMDRSRFLYPERPIMFISICYFMLSLGFVLRLSLGHDKVACDSLRETNGQRVTILRYGNSGPVQCTVVFLLIYYFGMAASLWWVILTITWFLAAGLKWGSEAIANYSQLYHFIAWFLPGVMCLLALTMSAIDGDPVSGICFIGNTSDFNLIIFVIAPLILYLVIGTLVLFSGFASLFRIRNIMKVQRGCKTDKLDKLMIRIGIFSFLYTVPTTIMIVCVLYELHQRSEWYHNLSCDCFDSHQRKVELPQPSFPVYMLKYFMFMATGVTSGFWVWTQKTIRSWKQILYRLGIRNTDIEYRSNPYDENNPNKRWSTQIHKCNTISLDSESGPNVIGCEIVHCHYGHCYPNENSQMSFMNHSQSDNSNHRSALEYAPNAPYPSLEYCKDLPLCVSNFKQSQEIAYPSFLSGQDTSPSCYFSSSGDRSRTSSGVLLKQHLFPLTQL